jgi:sulfate transport system ATP-binding protein
VQPRVLLLDEPFSALDAKVRKELRAWLRNLHCEMHVTTVIVTHDQEEAMEVADRIVVMNEGRIEQIGSPAEIYDHPATPFVMSFVGAVNVLPQGAIPVPQPSSGSGLASAPPHGEEGPSNGQIFIRPHDVEVYASPRAGSVPARLRRLTHMGRDLQAELQLDSGEVLVAQFPREQIRYSEIQAGDELHVISRQVRTFVPDYSI